MFSTVSAFARVMLLARSTRWCKCEKALLLGLLTLSRRQDDGPDLTPITYHLNHSKTTYSERIFHADLKLKEFCNEHFCNVAEFFLYISLL